MSEPEAAALEAATAHQPRARLALASALASGPSHAYLFEGPRGSGKAAAARAFAAEIIAAGLRGPGRRDGGGCYWTPRLIRTSSGCRRAGPSTWSTTSASR